MQLESNIALHLQVKMDLEARIRNGDFKPGDRLPTEPELMRQFGVSRGTVRKAYDALVHKGVVERKSGKGSFVSRTYSGQRLSVGLVVHSLDRFNMQRNPTNWQLSVDKMNGVLSLAAEKGIQVELIPYSPNLLDLHRHDGYVFMANFKDLFQVLNERGDVPYTVFCEGDPEQEVNGICFDISHCFYEAMDFIGSKGFANTAYIGPVEAVRLDNFNAILEKYDCPQEPELFEESSIGTVEDGFRAAERLFSRRVDIEAVFCTTDLRALGVMDYLHEKRIRIPEDVSVMGFDNLKQSEYSDPPLTTYETPRFKGGRHALSMLLEHISNPSYNPGMVVEAGKVIERKSVRNHQ